MTKTLRTKLIIFLTLTLLLLSTFFFYDYIQKNLDKLLNPKINIDINNCELKVHFIDVGHGDCTLIELPDNKIMLIDSGSSKAEDKTLKYLNMVFSTRKNKKIDYFIVTHQDEDHIGGADIVFDNFEVQKFYRPNIYTPEEVQEFSLTNVNQCTSVCFKIMIEKMNKEKGCKSFVTLIDNNPNFLNLEENLSYQIDFYSPKKPNYTIPNNYSPVMMIKYQNRKILLTGDAEKEIEREVVLSQKDNLKADILKVGHHGSKTSSTEEFLQAVSPKFAVISCGDSYNLPEESVYSRLQTIVPKNNIFITKNNGNVVMGLDKDSLINNKAEIKISVNQNTIVPVKIDWWCVVIVIDGLFFIIIFLSNKQKKELKKQLKKSKK